MNCPLIKALITEGWRDPVSTQLFKLPVATVVIEAGLAAAAAELIKPLALGRKYVLVSDIITHEVLGAQIGKALASLGSVVSLILPLGVKADSSNAMVIMQALSDADTLVAVGSGTINDLCKYASFLAGKPYLVFGTAPSMNGYCSANASIAIGGYKKTIPCHLPHAVFLDLAVFAAAPKRLIRGGLGDSLCRSTAQADWLLSHMLWKTDYSEVPFTWLQTYEEALFSQSKALVEGDKEALRLLAYTLVLSGFGMVVSGGSYPASQGEHIIAHTMEMASRQGERTLAYHGEQIGVTTLTMAGLQYALLQKKPLLKETVFPRRAIALLFGRGIAEECSKEFAAKKMGGRKIGAVNDQIEACWGMISDKLARVMVPERQLREVLKNAGGVTAPWEIGWQEGQYAQALRFGSYTRNRFTFLDMARLCANEGDNTIIA